MFSCTCIKKIKDGFLFFSSHEHMHTCHNRAVRLNLNLPSLAYITSIAAVSELNPRLCAPFFSPFTADASFFLFFLLQCSQHNHNSIIDVTDVGSSKFPSGFVLGLQVADHDRR